MVTRNKLFRESNVQKENSKKEKGKNTNESDLKEQKRKMYLHDDYC